MINPIMSQVQYSFIQSIIEEMRATLSSSSMLNLAPGQTLQARASQFDDMINAVAQENLLDPSLLKAVVHAESGFSPVAESHVGAKGLMQLMDATARGLGVTDSFDPEQNLEGGAKFLRQLLNRFDGDEVRALAAYNAGPGAVEKWGGVPPYQETQMYVPRVLDLRNQYKKWSG